MRRRNLFAALLAAVGAKAQEPMGGYTAPRNGRCPVCGWQAEAWHRPTREVIDRYEVNPNQRDDDPSTWWVSKISHREPYGPTERRIDCERCGNTYRQKAEARHE